MSNYNISEYSYQQAKKINLVIKPSKNKNKKIDVYRNGVFITSIVANSYKDYPTYVLEKGDNYANKRRILYKKRHEKYRHIKESPSFLSDNILW